MTLLNKIRETQTTGTFGGGSGTSSMSGASVIKNNTAAWSGVITTTGGVGHHDITLSTIDSTYSNIINIISDFSVAFDNFTTNIGGNDMSLGVQLLRNSTVLATIYTTSINLPDAIAYGYQGLPTPRVKQPSNIDYTIMDAKGAIDGTYTIRIYANSSVSGATTTCNVVFSGLESMHILDNGTTQVQNSPMPRFRQAFVTNLTGDTWTVPAGVTEVLVAACGGGGGGAGGSNGGGGGGGAGLTFTYLTVVPGEVYTVTLGAGGVGGSGGGNGGKGGTTYLKLSGVTKVSALGADGGQGAGSGGAGIYGGGDGGAGAFNGNTGSGGSYFFSDSLLGGTIMMYGGAGGAFSNSNYSGGGGGAGAGLINGNFIGGGEGASLEATGTGGMSYGCGGGGGAFASAYAGYAGFHGALYIIY